MAKMLGVLVVEDDASLLRVLRDNLVFEGYRVECVSDAEEAIVCAKKFTPDLIILDVMLPCVNGFELAKRLRVMGNTPFLFLTARTQRNDKLKGLSLGADDYITKPFDLAELLLRVRIALRRHRAGVRELYLGDVRVDFQSHTARSGSKVLHLTHRELELLHYLAERPGQVVHRDELLQVVWGYAQAPFTRSVDNAIARLRKKVEVDPHNPRWIHTVHGDGYCLTLDHETSVGHGRPRASARRHMRGGST